jgi:FlaA1/EpsC-like NDP-sugar epimerase
MRGTMQPRRWLHRYRSLGEVMTEQSEPRLHWLLRYRTPLQAGADVVSWAFALTFAVLARFDFTASRLDDTRLLPALAIAGAMQLVAGLTTGLYRGRRRYGSFDEVAVLAPATLIVTVALFAANLVSEPLRMIPMSTTVGGGIFALVLMGSTRYAWRLRLERRRRPIGPEARRLLVFGAGDPGVQIINALLNDSSAPYIPVALLDDDPTHRNLRVRRVPVAGNRTDIADAAAQFEADTLLIALPEADAALVRELSALGMEAGLDVRVLPSVRELLDGDVGVKDIRPVSDSDILGRHGINTDVAAIAGYLKGKRVLVTGAGGSIGAELCRQVQRFAPDELFMLDHDESALHALQLAIEGRAALAMPNVLLVDIRDHDRIHQVFSETRPEVVFHAAALKHVTALQRHPWEAWKTNVLGTLNLLEAAKAWGTERFVNISTDKAADPASVLGYTKRIAERLTAHVGKVCDGAFLSVRFGNVLGSRGSVLDVFQAQFEAGGPLTVSHPEVTRYFMTVEEAVELVVQAGAIGRSGEALVLDMGKPVRILEIARRLAAQAQPPLDIVFTELSPGEKLNEQLLGPGERDVRPVHALISHVDVPPLLPDRLWEKDPTSLPVQELIDWLKGLATTDAPWHDRKEA